MTPPPHAPQSTQPLRIGIAGLGTVGSGVIRLLDENAALIARRAGREIRVTAVAARDATRDRGIDLGAVRWHDDAVALAHDPEVDAVVEVVGGADGIALALAEASLAAGKPFVTANKAMIAAHGMALAARAEAADIALKFEAAVAGGIPVIKALREGASANRIERVYGILNGTCNFILTAMESRALSFEAALAEAQALGYAEADPGFDIDGVDASHKLAILAAICFSARTDVAGVTVEGIRAISAEDIKEADALGYRIRLIAMAEMQNGALLQYVRPCLVAAEHPLGYVPGCLNAVVAEGNFVGRLFLEGAGAGDGPTASAVVADIIDVARDEYGPAFTMAVGALDALPRADAGHVVGKSYIRLHVADRTGVLAEIAIAMRDAGVSVESLIQRGGMDGEALIVLVTHASDAAAVDGALNLLARGDALVAPPLRLPILAL